MNTLHKGWQEGSIAQCRQGTRVDNGVILDDDEHAMGEGAACNNATVQAINTPAPDPLFPVNGAAAIHV